MNTKSERLPPLSEELSGVELGNRHLTKRFMKMLDAMGKKPSASFPEIFESEKELEGAYRFLRNPSVTWRKMLLPHYEQTLAQMKDHREVLIVHDTTDCVFGGFKRREGLGYINQHETTQGFFGHFALAVSAGEASLPLGMIGAELLSRPAKPSGKRLNCYQRHRDPKRESLRWVRLVKEVQQRVGDRAQPVHIMDREADIYELLDELTSNDQRFVIRLCHDRALRKGQQKTRISEALKNLPVICDKEIFVSFRGKSNRKKRKRGTHPPREYRSAKLGYSAITIEINRPFETQPKYSKSIRLNVIQVEEINPPSKEDKIQWRLLTTEPIENEKQILKVVDFYRGRWMIEEFFKVLKTGCSYEKRQLESFWTLTNALGFFIPIAHRLLLLRHLSRSGNELPENTVLTRTQRIILKSLPNTNLPSQPSAQDVLMAIARLGGHIKNNGDPGWLVLWRGYQKLLDYEVGWNAKK